MNILLPKLKHAFLFRLAAAFLSVMAIGQAAPSNAQQRRPASRESESGAQYAEAADKLAGENRWAEAVDAYKLVIRQHPKYGPAYKGLGDAYLNVGRWEDALATYKEAVRMAPNDADAWYDLGYCYNTMGRHGEAFAPLVRATNLDPGFAEAFYGIGYAYLRGSQYEKSLSFLKSAIRLDPDYADAYYGLALAYTRLGKVALAGESRKKLIALDLKLNQKLDREIQTPPSALAGPLPAPDPPQPTRAGKENQSKPVAVEQNPASQSQQQTTSVEKTPAPQTKAEPSEAAAPGDQAAQKQPVAEPVSDKALPSATQPASERELPPRPETTTTTTTTTPPVHLSEPESAKQVLAAQPSPAPAAQPATGDGSATPAPAATQPAATSPLSVWPAKAKRWALVIGVDNYSASTLHGAANDARTLAEALIQYAGFPSDQVILLSSDQPSQHQSNRSTILQSLRNLRGQVPKDGLLLVSFAGHGIERSGRSYLLPSDALAIDDVSLLEDTAVNVDRVKELIRAIGVAQVLLVLDASRNDPTPGRIDGDNPLTSNFSRRFNFDLKNREVIAFATLYATAVGQRAYEYGAKKQGYFSWALVAGLRGEAANDKGEVTLASLMKYVQETVPRNVRRDLGAGKQQEPFAIVEGYNADELVIAVVKKNAP